MPTGCNIVALQAPPMEVLGATWNRGMCCRSIESKIEQFEIAPQQDLSLRATASTQLFLSLTNLLFSRVSIEALAKQPFPSQEHACAMRWMDSTMCYNCHCSML